ncbi:hypothetical protein XM38_032800 [Halomicronema hongdechloris C2206]|uniref:Uncharacterized protein n=1 Tax=Halomicronema hongdechloris C2206 TaxID=1641165 RepID=A0A1Z3HPU2_9CYAN|nr:hypothetical protein [Halomicronema hongdechloris]ASC72323.1 hypothetical protein XM38_032800 [Halomicronema hongdechloris C2206]
MSYKTDKLVDLFPDAYAARDTESLLYKLLDAIGAEFMAADEALKRLLKSHWIDYADGAALDGLGAIYGVTRRRLRNGTLETDAAFRLRLKSIVALFTGGGTVAAVKRAVRSALGLPLDLDQLTLPPEFEGLREELKRLVSVREFSPNVVRFIPRPDEIVQTVEGASELILRVDISTTENAQPEIRWKFTKGSGRRLTLEQIQVGNGPPAGIRATDDLVVQTGQTLVLANGENGQLNALLEQTPSVQTNVSTFFTNLDGSRPAALPEVSTGSSEWKFRAQSGLFGISAFDTDSFDLPDFTGELVLIERQRLSFDVYVPYFLQQFVQDLKQRYGYSGNLFVFEGLHPDQIQTVVNQTKAAGVRGNVYFSLNFLENHNPREALTLMGDHRAVEDANVLDSLAVGSLNRDVESHMVIEKFVMGGVFNVATFDTHYGFL